VLVLTGVLGGRTAKPSLTVGKDISADEITEFYYTYDASTNPPEFQRFRFYKESANCCFYHETREGDHWPLTEADISSSGTKELTAQQWQAFVDCVDGGTVRKRAEHTEAGDAGPWLYLYWRGDGGDYQEFTFASAEKQAAFEALCESLKAQS